MPEAKVFRLSRSFEVWPSLLSWFWGWSTAGILELKFGCDPGTGLLSITGLGSLNIILQLWNIYWKEMRTTKEHIKAMNIPSTKTWLELWLRVLLFWECFWINQSWFGLAAVGLSLATHSHHPNWKKGSHAHARTGLPPYILITGPFSSCRPKNT